MIDETIVGIQSDFDNRYWLDENEWKRYCAFKHIEPEIRGCLDREREYVKQIAVLEKELNDWRDGTIIVKWCKAEEKCKVLEKAQKEFAIEKLREIKNEINNNAFDSRAEECKVVSHFKANTIIQKKIEELANE